MLNVQLKATYDPETDSLYIYVSENQKALQTMPVTNTTLLDLDKAGNVVGIEILRFHKTRKKKDDSGTTNTGTQSLPWQSGSGITLGGNSEADSDSDFTGF